MRDPAERFAARMALEPLDLDLYLGKPGGGEGRLFGGLVAAQSIVAAYRTLPDAAESPIAHAARGLIFGSMFTPDGRQIASVAQEGLIRIPRA